MVGERVSDLADRPLPFVKPAREKKPARELIDLI
jgi:hypothetical protein